MSLLLKPRICIGLAVEGESLKLATLVRDGKRFRVSAMASTPIQTQKFANTSDQEDDSSSGTNIGFDNDQAEEEINYQAIRDFLSGYLRRHIPLAAAYGEPTIRAIILSKGAKDKQAKTTKAILAEIQQIHNIELAKDMMDWSPINDRSVLAAARLEVAPLLDIYANPTGTDKRPTQIAFVTSNDIALVNMVRVHFRFKAEEVTHVIHVSHDETKVYVMRGNDILHVAPVIMQGSRDRDIASLLLTRIELATDSAGFPTPNHIVLSGHAERIGLREALNEFHPDAIVHSLTKLRIVTPGDEDADIADFILPISIAWQALDTQNEHFYRINVLPMRLRADQNKFKLRWHGMLLLLALFGITTGLTLKGLEQHASIAEMKSALNFEKQQIREQQEIVARIDALEARSVDVLKATTTLDTLLNNSDKWSVTLDTLANGVAALKTLWISEMKPNEKGVNVQGYSLNRGNVPSYATVIGNGRINEISVQTIGKQKVLRYSIDLDVPSRAPAANSPAGAWHRTLSIPKLNNSGSGAQTQQPKPAGGGK